MLDYESAGVSLKSADSWVDAIKGLLGKYPSDPNVVGGIGGFSGLYSIGGGTLIAACCDGVGTKLEIARECGIYRGLGQDLVAMNVNDLVTCGARPIFFLDYAAVGVLDVAVLTEIVDGVLGACAESGCALLGGETAEMPGVYPVGGFDLAGFAVGIVQEQDLIRPERVRQGDAILGLPSSGVHSNGYSLVRRALLGHSPLDINTAMCGDESLADAVLRPTKLYVRAALRAAAAGCVHAMAHITGGGMEGNVSRVMPEGMGADIDFSSWRRPEIFNLIASRGVEEEEMRRVFNLGIGYVIITDDEGAVRTALGGEEVMRIGTVV